MRDFIFHLSAAILLITGNSLFSQPNWVQLNSGVTAQLNVIAFVNSNTGYAAGTNSVLIKTTNAGVSWLSSNGGAGQGSIYKVSFPGIDTGYILIDSSFITKIYKTTNQGQSWFSLPPPQNSFKDFHFINGSTGYGAGYNVYKTTNGGVNWVNIALSNVYYTTSIYMVNGSEGYIAGARTEHPLDRTSIFSSSTGTSWDMSYTSQGYAIFKMGNFYDVNNGAFITTIPTANIYRKRNGGNWTVESLNVESIDYASKDLVFACGLAGLILKSFNGGDNWFNSASGVNSALHSVWFVDTAAGYVCGDNGIILKTTNGGGIVGINLTGTEIPNSFSLLQNYPNPFNPTTNIKFQIPKSGFVKLIIFDVLGKEVQTLVNKQLSPGTYSADFDGTSLPSGIYYYRLEVGDPSTPLRVTETKKMVLIK